MKLTHSMSIATCVLAGVVAVAGCSAPSTEGEPQEHKEHAHEDEKGQESAPHKGEGHDAHDEHTEGGEHEAGEAEEDHGQLVELTPEARKAAGLMVAAAGPARLKETVLLYGVVKPNAERVRNVAARFPGIVRTVNVKVGDSIAEGAILATVESNESLQEYAVRSPLAGVITERATNPGEQAEAQPLFTVADLSSVWIELAMFSRDRARITTGQSVRIRTTDGGLTGEGKIVFVSPLGATQTQSLTARVLLDNADRRWAPGLYVRGEVAVAEQQVPVAVPAQALQQLESGPSVFVDGAQGIEPRKVTIGRSDGQIVEVLAGVAAGENVIGAGSFVLKAEMGKGEAEHAH